MITFVGTRHFVAIWEKRGVCVTEPQKRTTGTPNMPSSSFQTLVSKGNSCLYYHNKRTPFNLLTSSYGLRTTFNLQASTARLLKRKLKSGDLDHHPQLTTFLLKFWPTSSIFPSKHPHHSVLDIVINWQLCHVRGEALFSAHHASRESSAFPLLGPFFCDGWR